MAALCPGDQYGLSSQQNFGENKDLIFVKLTDSSLRAIEEYLRNQNKFSCQNPTIKFFGNEGLLSFPSLHNGNTSFKFSMSSTADMEGPGGSFECVQQTGPPRGSLEALGSIPYKVRIRANDDVYETTRHRMTVAEENHKNKCTREIKPNQTDIGRKVKVKQQSRTPIPPHRRETPPLRESLSKPSYQSNVPSKSIVHSSSNGITNGMSNNLNSTNRPPFNNKPSTPDITRRPLKERLIHLLALKPFKKVELHERLMKEGLREKNGMTSVLKQVSSLKGNCFHLNRAMWNEVDEDWPFYTESERQMLKRRKPQNLTPPGSSDGGSSGSGQSPTSTHPGSPPPISSKRPPSYHENSDVIPVKRARISHYQKPNEQSIYRSPIENNSQRRPVTDSRDASNMNPRSRESPPNTTSTTTTTMPSSNGYSPFTNGYTNNNNGMLNGEKRSYSDDEDNANRKRTCDSNNSVNYSVIREKTFGTSNGNSGGGSGSVGDSRSASSPAKFLDEQQQRRDTANDRNGFMTNGNVPNGKYAKSEPKSKISQSQVNYIKDRNKYDKVTSSQNNRISRISPNSQTDRLVDVDDHHSPPSPVKSNVADSTSEFPDYLTEYTTIKDAAQRRRYKADFNADYAEYRDLHGIVEKVSRRFAELEERLKQEDTKSPKYKDIKKQIVREYQENKNDVEHQRSKRRFQYLHEKLSHIKRLVLEYDQGLTNNRY